MLDVRRSILNDYHYHLVYQHTEIHDEVLTWLSSIPLSRPIWDIGEDFADGILTADIILHYCPEFIDMDRIHVPKNMSQRTANWHYLSNEALPKLGLYLPNMLVVDLTNGVHRAAEIFLLQLRTTIQQHLMRSQQASYQQQETLNLLPGGSQRLPQIQATPRQGATTTSNAGSNTSGANGNHQPGNKNSKQHQIKGSNSTIVKATNSMAAKGANSSRVPGKNSSVITGANASGVAAGTNGNGDSFDPSLAPCRDALRLKDKEIDELREKVKTYEKLLREKVKVYEKLLRAKDDKIQDLETRLGNAKLKRPKP